MKLRLLSFFAYLCLLSASFTIHSMEHQEASESNQITGKDAFAASHIIKAKDPQTGEPYEIILMLVKDTPDGSNGMATMKRMELMLKEKNNYTMYHFLYTPEEALETSDAEVIFPLNQLLSMAEGLHSNSKSNTDEITLLNTSNQDIGTVTVSSAYISYDKKQTQETTEEEEEEQQPFPQIYLIISVPDNSNLTQFSVSYTKENIQNIQKQKAATLFQNRITNVEDTFMAAATFSSSPTIVGQKETLTTIILLQEKLSISLPSLKKGLASLNNYFLQIFTYYAPAQNIPIFIPLSIANIMKCINNTQCNSVNLAYSSGKLTKNPNYTSSSDIEFSKNTATGQLTLQQPPYNHYIIVIIGIPFHLDLHTFVVTDNVTTIKQTSAADQQMIRNPSWFTGLWLKLKGYEPHNQSSKVWIKPIDWKQYFTEQSSQFGKYALYGAGLVGAAGAVYTIYRGPKQAAQDAKKLIDQGKQLLKQKVPAAVARGKELIAKGRKMLSGK